MPIERLAILDFGGRRSQRPSWTAINETVRAALLAEKVGYHRYWLAEHQAFGDAWGTAALMLGHLASKTRSIRLGSAGVLIGYHDPFDSAADYRLLSALHPGRIDVGIAGGGPSMLGLRDRAQPRDYPERAQAFIRLLRRGQQDPEVAEEGMLPLPADVTFDMPWLLGSGTRSRDLALRERTAFCYSLFHSPRIDPAILAEYLDRFEPDARSKAPQASVCAAVICAETESEAEAIHVRQAAGLTARGATLNAKGTPPQCAEQLEELAHRYRVQEVVIHDVCRTVPERRRCYELLAEALETSVPAPARQTA